MTTPLHVIENKSFIGRENERNLLKEISDSNESGIIVIYGRRRVGKTELLEQAYRKRNLLKFEGIEGEDTQSQMRHVLLQLANYTGESYISNLQFDSWVQVFEIIAKYVKKGVWTVYFEEVQWLAEYQHTFIAELKYVWDNYFRYNKKLKMILCGSSPSFMIGQVLHSKALYNRSIHELHLQEFNLHDIQLLLKKRSRRDIMDAYLTLGGIPEYLKRIKASPSLFLGICKKSFSKGGYFANECDRIFISSLAENKHYKMIIDFLSKRRFASRKEIAKHLGVKSGGQLSMLLNDLSLSGFVGKYTPYNLKPDSILSRYCIQDFYLNFYFKFIQPIKHDIDNGDYSDSPTTALDMASYQKWLGFAFERFCRKNHRIIAKILGFSDIRYRHGVYFSRKTDSLKPGYQIDLVFERADNVMAICEIKYLQGKAGTNIIQELENKVDLFNIPPRFSIQRILITSEGASNALVSRAYFDRIIVLDDFFEYG